MALIVLTGFSWALQTQLEACGPGFTEAVFRDIHRPDTSWAEAVRGHVGILRPGLPTGHLVIAYRHLAGLPVEVETWDPIPAKPPATDPEPYRSMEKRWQDVVSTALGSADAKPLDTGRTTDTYQWFSNVGDHAIALALATWKDRCRDHGPTDPLVRSWLKAQDQVFRSTPKEPRIPDPVSSPEWLRRDRDYQRAAAFFYADRWDEARAAFTAVSKDLHSPWRAWGGFLVARCWMRQASLGPEKEAPARWREARSQLDALLKDQAFSAVHADAQDYLEFTRYQLEPGALYAEALEGLVARQSGPGWLEQHKQSLQRLGRDHPSAKIPAMSPSAEDLRAWLDVMRSTRPSVQVVEDRWTATHGLPWLVAGLAVLPSNHRLLPELEAVAERVPPSHAAGASLRWHRVREALAMAPPADVPSRAQAALKEPWPAWAENALRAEGRAHAQTAGQWAGWAGSKVVGLSDMDTEGSWVLPEGTAKRYGQDPILFDPEAAGCLNACFPLQTWLTLLEGPGLTAPLKQDLAQAAWVRAVLLGDWKAEQRARAQVQPSLRPLLPADLPTLDPGVREFRLVQVFMANPGLSPLVQEGLGRSNYGWVPTTETVDFGTNWWCLPASEPGSPKYGTPAFLTQEERHAAEAEWTRLRRFPSARHWFGKTVTAYAEAHPKDPAVPQALHRFVRITRNASCYDKDLSALGQQAFRLLHRHYPDDPWTRKTPVYY
jgi:hypothetical protein